MPNLRTLALILACFLNLFLQSEFSAARKADDQARRSVPQDENELFSFERGRFFSISRDAKVYYDYENKIPRFAIEILTADKFENAEVKHRQNSFVVDKSLKKTFRTSGSDYKHSSDFKIDRGHLIPAGNHIKHADKYNRTFFYWNIFPQNSYLNRGAWLTAEHLARDLVRSQGIDKLYVYSGTLFLTKSEQMMGSFKRFYTLGNSTVSVPDSVFKIYFGIKGSKTYIHAVKFPNTRVKIKSSKILIEHGVKNLNELESISGTIFPDSLTDNHNLNLCEHFKCTIDEELLENMEKLHEDL